MSNDKDEQSTIIIDFKSLADGNLKREKDQNGEIETLEDLEFNIPEDDEDNQYLALTQSNILNEIKCPLYYLEFKTDFFSKIDFSKNFQTATSIADINHLNTVLTKKEPSILLIYYNSSPKLSNQVILQIKEKFPEIKIIIIAKNLSTEKAKLHAQSKYAAHEYISYPFLTENLEQKINILKKIMIPE